jgi:hypothetical protein
MSAVIPTGTVGAPSGGDDMDIAATGGSKFMARLQQLAVARDRHDEALAALKLGTDAKTAAEAAQAQKAEAADLHRQAVVALAGANAEATRITGMARNEAARVLKEAQDRATGLLASGEAAKRDADAYAARVHGEAGAAKEEAAKLKAGAIAAQQRADQTAAEAKRVREAADSAQYAADQLLARVHGVIAKMRGVISELPATG